MLKTILLSGKTTVFFFPEPYEYGALSNKDRPLYQHSIAGKEIKHLILGHLGKLILELQRFVQQSARVGIVS